MHWSEIIVGFLLGGFAGIILMAALFVADKADYDTEKYFASSADNEKA